MEDLWSVGYQPQRRYGPSRRAICLCSSVIISLIFGGIIYKVHSGLNGPDQVFNNKVGNESTNVAGFNMNSDLSKPIRTASAKQNGTALPGAQVSTTGNANEETSGDLDRNTGNSASDLALAGGFSTLDVNYDDIYVNAEYSYDTEYLAAPEDNHGATNPSDESSSRLAKRGIPPFLQGIFYYYYDMEDFLGFTDSNYTIGDEEINKASSVPAEQENATATRTSTDLFFLDANATSAAPSVAAHAG